MKKILVLLITLSSVNQVFGKHSESVDFVEDKNIELPKKDQVPGAPDKGDLTEEEIEALNVNTPA